MDTERFFNESRDQSKIKAKIVAKYFRAWATVIMATMRNPAGRLAYVDLFGGPGQYHDGTPSTPVIVIQAALKDPKLSERLVALFNDIDNDNVLSLREAISAIPGIGNLRYQPRVENEEVGQKIGSSISANEACPDSVIRGPLGIQRVIARADQFRCTELGLRLHLLFQL